MTGMRMLKLWVVVMLLGLLPVVSEAQEEINNAINVQLEYLEKYPKDKEALRKVSFLYLNKADYDQAIFYGRQLILKNIFVICQTQYLFLHLNFN